MAELNTKPEYDLVFNTGKSVEEEQFLFACRGNFNTTITDNILLLTEDNLLALDTNKVAKKVYYLMVEGLQNITRHQHFDETGANSMYDGGLFIIKRKKAAYSITYGNYVDEEVRDVLTHKLHAISEKDSSELKEYYLEILNNTSFSHKGGAGLGLVDMARKSSGKLIFEFQPIPDGFFYYLNLFIAIDSELYEDCNQEDYLKEAIGLHNEMLSSNSLILFKGLLNEGNVAHLSNQIDTTVSDIPEGEGLGLVMTELLKNVAKHAYNRFNQSGKPGVFLLQRELDFNMLTGNFIQERKKDQVREVLHAINDLTTEELNAIISNKVAIHQELGELPKGQGLANLRRITGHSFQHNIIDSEDNPPYLILKIQVKG
jgi:hypothetical protein